MVRNFPNESSQETPWPILAPTPDDLLVKMEISELSTGDQLSDDNLELEDTERDPNVRILEIVDVIQQPEKTTPFLEFLLNLLRALILVPYYSILNLLWICISGAIVGSLVFLLDALLLPSQTFLLSGWHIIIPIGVVLLLTIVVGLMPFDVAMPIALLSVGALFWLRWQFVTTHPTFVILIFIGSIELMGLWKMSLRGKFLFSDRSKKRKA